MSASQRLRELADKRPDDLAYRFVHTLEESNPITYGELDTRAQKIAAFLAQQGQKGRVVPLVFKENEDFLSAFFGCLYARAIPAPLPSPLSSFGKDTNLARTRGAIRTAKAERVFGDEEAFQDLGLSTGLTLAEATAHSLDPVFELPDSKDPAFVQFSSGSTRDPKGIVVSHGNLAANQTMIQESFCHEEDEVIGGWLPHYHDMGLVGIILTPLFRGLPCMLALPGFFAKKPVRWLQMISKFRINSTGAPNFAYELCSRTAKTMDLIDVDLSCLRVAFNGSDMIQPGTLKEFTEKFSLYGFDPKSFLPCYGMAETTLIVSGVKRGSGSDHLTLDREALSQGLTVKEESGQDGRSVANCGPILRSTKVLIKEGDRELPPGRVGEISVKGDSVAQSLLTELGPKELPTDREGYFHTGDLGFITDNQLYILGRNDNRFVVRGKNIHSEEVEALAATSQSLVTNRGMVAFTHEEKISLAIELPANRNRVEIYSEVFHEAVDRIAKGLGFQIDEILFLPKKSFSKTSSGKIRRQSLISSLKSGNVIPLFVATLESVVPTEKVSFPTDELRNSKLRTFVINKVAAILRIDPAKVDADAKFTQLGLDSMSVTALHGELEERLGKPLPQTIVWDYPTINLMCSHLEEN